MGKIRAKLTILFILAAVLAGGFYYLKNGSMQDVSTALSQTVSSEEKNYTVYQYKITKVDGTEYQGVSDNGTKIIFDAKNLDQDLSDIKEGDKVKAYFSNANRIDGLIKVVKVTN
ncbi:hypothetical protein OZL92_04110 [Bacillus sonorensis]|uniref:Uncharacterized protein n=2 Tax=Bacillus sonorensis TaxID=119858 RepID=M5PG11_9BACI|nr:MULTISPECIES: hypothetical protein [Bacillus]TWK82637.1 hypothetical protein CHCC20335_3680 [Bacillus paralicheniformis]ASB88641.1 uncharacterized protein S101395_02133 [Bacillus sonorensis]EME76550.1 hypothetical protein BSONL12_02177 [Bacillus sonorensis L12]MBG9915546.1 hypothetical protein [Bacillus sonorensis]MCF7617996.1 hypothetical protein [Bacillus sonorensis]